MIDSILDFWNAHLVLDLRTSQTGSLPHSRINEQGQASTVKSSGGWWVADDMACRSSTLRLPTESPQPNMSKHKELVLGCRNLMITWCAQLSGTNLSILNKKNERHVCTENNTVCTVHTCWHTWFTQQCDKIGTLKNYKFAHTQHQTLCSSTQSQFILIWSVCHKERGASVHHAQTTKCVHQGSKICSVHSVYKEQTKSWE